MSPESPRLVVRTAPVLCGFTRRRTSARKLDTNCRHRTHLIKSNQTSRRAPRFHPPLPHNPPIPNPQHPLRIHFSPSLLLTAIHQIPRKQRWINAQRGPATDAVGDTECVIRGCREDEIGVFAAVFFANCWKAVSRSWVFGLACCGNSVGRKKVSRSTARAG